MFAMGIRRKSREMALQVLYQIEITGDASRSAVELFFSHFDGSVKAIDFARSLVSGVLDHKDEIDRAIRQAAENWKISRMAKVDLTILRMASYEMLFCPDIPINVTMDEAIEIGKRYGSGESATFINGVLDQVALANDVKQLPR